MRYSRLFGKSVYGDQGGSKFNSHQLLVKGGFIRESTAGRYFFLPLGWRVHEKIRAIIKQEMDRAGAQEMITPTLHPLELWRETNRTSTVGFELMVVQDRRGAEFALGGTAEEMVVDAVRGFQISYRDLPFNIYQFSNKFRDELRARGGLLRVREFVMKDAYSFHTDAVDFQREYTHMGDVYRIIFDRMGLDTVQVEADNGYIGGDYCHEFVVDSPIGESRFLMSEDGTYAAHEDVARFYREPVNLDEPVLEFQIIDQPEWVKTMEDNERHYGRPRSHYLKNVVYRHTGTDEIIIAVVRGDLDVNKSKLEHVIDAVGQLEEATDADLGRIGTQRGWVHSWGHEGARYIGDASLTTVHNFIGGQKEETTDSVNVNYGRDFECEILADIAMAQAGHRTEDGSQRLVERRGIEVGNIFQLGYHYSEKMAGAVFTDKDGTDKPFYMGCYGIGLGRTMATIAEKYHDDNGIVWPPSVTPFHVHLVALRGAEAFTAEVYERLHSAGYDVLWDDRDESPGVKFNDADLIGIPVRLVTSKRNGDKLEWKRRDSDSRELLNLDEVVDRLTTIYH
ncbi:MAG: proline--tRNA ligase [Chloroflexi bacterium]|nr:proline--tRNA ligase [Chloroflexota bacterium]